MDLVSVTVQFVCPCFPFLFPSLPSPFPSSVHFLFRFPFMPLTFRPTLRDGLRRPPYDTASDGHSQLL